MYYSTLPSLVKNIRRGNTILKVYDKNTKLNDYYIGRKGLMKFFDMRLSFISKKERNVLNLNTHAVELHQEKNYIMAPILKAIA